MFKGHRAPCEISESEYRLQAPSGGHHDFQTALVICSMKATTMKGDRDTSKREGLSTADDTSLDLGQYLVKRSCCAVASFDISIYMSAFSRTEE